MSTQATWTWKVWPFDRSEHALDRVAMKLASEETFDPSHTTFSLEPRSEGSPNVLDLEFLLEVDYHAIESDTGVKRDAAHLAVIVNDTLSRTKTEPKRWSLDRVPRTWKHSLVDWSGDKAQMRVVVALASGLPESPDRPSRACRTASILCEKTFSLHVPTSRSLFPVQNTSFKQHGWDANALWYVEWLNFEAAHEQEPESVVVVHLNKDLPALQELWRTAATRSGALQRTTANMVRELAAGGIMTELCQTAVRLSYYKRRDDPDTVVDSESLTGRLLAALRKGLNLPDDKIIKLAGEDPGQLAMRLQGMMKSGAAFDLDSLNALRGQE